MNYGKKNASKKQREITSKANMQKKRIFSRLFKSVILCIIIIGIVGVIGAGFFVKKTIDNAPNISPANVKPTGYTTFVVDKDGNEIEKFVSSGSNRVYKTLDEIPVHLRQAFIAIEDSRFYQHKGIDLKGPIRNGISDEDLKKLIHDTIWNKPISHKFGHANEEQDIELKNMVQIGG